MKTEEDKGRKSNGRGRKKNTNEKEEISKSDNGGKTRRRQGRK